MPQAERGDETAARDLVEKALALTLRFADTSGGVDFRFDAPGGRSGALEVTTVTDNATKRNKAAWVQARQDALSPRLRHCWRVTVRDDSAIYKGLARRLEPLLVQAEAKGVNSFDSPLELLGVAPDLIAPLQQLAVVAATVAKTRAGVPSQIFLAPMGSSVSSGSDHALSLIEADLAAKPDNAQKLKRAHVDERHLFVWLDSDTPAPIRSPLEYRSSNPAEPSDLPLGDPHVDSVIDVLWIVHAGTRLGWQWTRGGGWRHVVGHTLV